MLIVVFVECVGISVDFVLVCRFWRHCCSYEHRQVMQLWEAGHLKEVYCCAQPTLVASPTVSIVSHFNIVYTHSFLVLKMVVVFLRKLLKKVIIRKKLLLCDAVLCLVLDFLMLQPYSTFSIFLFVGQVLTFSFMFLLMLIALLE
jgi:hypothetical protein